MTKSTSSPSRTEGGRRVPARLDNPLRVLSSLTERDRWIIELIAEHQVFTTSQLAELAFVGLDTAQRRLVRLWPHPWPLPAAVPRSESIGGAPNLRR